MVPDLLDPLDFGSVMPIDLRQLTATAAMDFTCFKQVWPEHAKKGRFR